ncbi:Mss4-like protein [Mycena maculata]|uniref:Mss4-like protein n=1 Tax=Mycena maculata TaxID=230809 RepID=A0AAD7J323_9AGAR|nr:Mss4-like protein [Mycena maculata]
MPMFDSAAPDTRDSVHRLLSSYLPFALAFMSIHAGACFCGSVSYTVTGQPTLSAYCHCTRCQASLLGLASLRNSLNSQIMTGSAFIWTLHYPAAAFAWTHPEPHSAALAEYVTEGKNWKTRWRCNRCGCCIASYNTKTEHWSVWGTQFEREEGGITKDLDGIKPTAHIFYGTRLVDVKDKLSKWEGYEDNSAKIVK